MNKIIMKKTDTATASDRLKPYLCNSCLTEVVKRGHEWIFLFSSGLCLQVFGIWRILAEGHIALTSEDDGQSFGLGAPVDAKGCSMKLLGSQEMDDFFIRTFTSDLILVLKTGVQLEILNDSSGYEAWLATCEGLGIAAQGGGQLSIWSAP